MIADIIVLTSTIFISGICILFSILSMYCNGLVSVCICFGQRASYMYKVIVKSVSNNFTV